MNKKNGIIRHLSKTCRSFLVAAEAPWIMVGLAIALVASAAWGWLAALGIFATTTAIAIAFGAASRIDKFSLEGEPADAIQACLTDRSCADKPCCAPSVVDSDC